MAVPEGNRQRLVAHQFLDGQDVHPGHCQPGGEGMAEVVKVEIFQLCCLHPPRKAVAHLPATPKVRGTRLAVL